MPASRLPYSVTLLCAHAVDVTTSPAAPAAMMRFTLGTPDRVVESRTRRFLFLCLSSLWMAFWSPATLAIHFMFHLWAYVSPMESIESQLSDQKSFCDGEDPHSSDHLGAVRARSLCAATH